MSLFNLHSESSYKSVSRFKFLAKSMDDGVASVWGGATTISSDSGVSSCSEGSCPDLLECISLQDLEERVNQIKSGNVKRSESICYNNLLNLLQLQQLQPGAEISSTPMKRAIIGSGAAEREFSSKIQPPSNSNLHGDLHCLSALLDQDVPLAFPGELPINLKISPQGHPPAVKYKPPVHSSPLSTKIGASQPNLDVMLTPSPLVFPGNSTTNYGQFSSIKPVSSLFQKGTSKVFHPSLSASGPTESISNVPKMSLHNLSKFEETHNIKFCIDEAHYQLMTLTRERTKIDMISSKNATRDNTVEGLTRKRPRSIKGLLYEIDKEISNVKVVAKSLGQLGVDLLSACTYLKRKIMASYGENDANMSESLRKISKDIRKLRTVLWSLSAANLTH